jgi:hypothetical protein
MGQERAVAFRGLERDRQSGRLTGDRHELVRETGGSKFLGHPTPEWVIPDASHQPHVHSGLDERERGIGAGTADADAHLLGQRCGAGWWKLGHRAHHDIGLDASDDCHSGRC